MKTILEKVIQELKEYRSHIHKEYETHMNSCEGCDPSNILSSDDSYKFVVDALAKSKCGSAEYHDYIRALQDDRLIDDAYVYSSTGRYDGPKPMRAGFVPENLLPIFKNEYPHIKIEPPRALTDYHKIIDPWEIDPIHVELSTILGKWIISFYERVMD